MVLICLPIQVSYAEDLENQALSPPDCKSGVTLPGTGITDLYEVSQALLGSGSPY